MQGSLVTHNKLAPNAIAAATTALKAKFGPATEVSVGFMALNAKLDGEIVGTAQPNGVFHEALGVTQSAGEDGKVSSFPFHISPYEVRDSIHPALVPMLKMRLALAFERSVDFDLNDFSISRCRQLSADELGRTTADRILHLGRSTVCTVTWKRAPSQHADRNVVADAGFWIRPFAPSACRTLSKARLANAGSPTTCSACWSAAPKTSRSARASRQSPTRSARMARWRSSSSGRW